VGHTEGDGTMADWIRRSLGAGQMEGDETDRSVLDQAGDHGSAVYQTHHRVSVDDDG